jgi:hypothetical protein
MNTMVPIRPSVRRARRISLPAGPEAPAKARRHVRAAIYAWVVPVDLAVAVLLTSELVTNAIRYETADTVMLAISNVCDQFRVDVHDTSCFLPVPAHGSPDTETGRGLILVASLATQWGFYPTPVGKAVYFTLAFRAYLDEDEDRSLRRG